MSSSSPPYAFPRARTTTPRRCWCRDGWWRRTCYGNPAICWSAGTEEAAGRPRCRLQRRTRTGLFSSSRGSWLWWWARATRPWARYCVAPQVAAGRKSACRSMNWSIRHPSDPTGASPRGCAGTTTAPRRRRSCRPPPFPFPRSPRRPVLPPRSAARIGRLARGAAYAAVAVLAVAVLVRLYSAVDPPASPASLAPPAGSLTAAAATPLERLDRVADTLALAIAAFDLRARLFASRQMQCPELGRGLVLVEERWTTYNSVRKERGTPLDSARTARDRALYTDVDGVERRFERTACTRP